MSSCRKPIRASPGRATASAGASSAARLGAERRPPADGRSTCDEPVLDRLDQTDREVRARGCPPPRRGALLDRGAGRSAVRSKAAEAAASSSTRSGSPAGASRRRIRRHSGVRPDSRAITSSSSDPVSDAPASSRRAASSSSATSGVAARPFGDQEEDRGGRPIAFDPLDELGQLIPIERLEGELVLGGWRRVRHRGQGGAERVARG